MAEPSSARRLLHFGVFELDVSSGELRKRGRKIDLQKQPLQVLALLLQHPGAVVMREELQRALWPADTFVEFDQGLNTAIKKIRQALDDSADSPRFVETLPRKGYRFIAPVSDAENGVASTAPARPSGQRMLWTVVALALVVTGSAAWLLNRPDSALDGSADADLVPVPLTSYPGMETWPCFSPDGNQVAFHWDNPGGQPGIYVKLVGESEPVRLTEGCCPSWSPDGRYLAFIKFQPRAGIFVIPATGGPDRKLTELNFEFFPGMAWHRSGRWLIVTGKDSVEDRQALFSFSLDSGEKQRLTSPPAGANDMYPALPPSGEAVVFSRRALGQSHLLLLALSEAAQAKGEAIRITSQNTYNNEPAWTSDGRAIVYVAGAFHAPGLYEMELSPGWRPGKPRRLAFAGEGVHTPVISSRGVLAYAAWTVEANIWRIALNGDRPVTEPPQRLIASTRLDHVPEYSPDGKRIAFASNRSGSQEIWVADSDGSRALQLTSFGGSFSTADPHWTPDGQSIVFNSDVEGQADAYIVDSEAGKPKPLYPNCGVNSWSRDGKWVYLERRGDQGESQVWKRPWPPSEHEAEPRPITRSGGSFARESTDGKVLYYQKSFKEFTSLWKVPVEGGEETEVIESIYSLAFAPVDQGIYFVPSKPGEDYRSIQFLSFATGRVTTIATTSGHVGYGFAVSPDGRWLIYSQYQPRPSDLRMVEKFR
jgi:Tol biopolymer transport system component/DNA-binding winged helix-turn-helix (wHTH) protein